MYGNSFPIFKQIPNFFRTFYPFSTGKTTGFTQANSLFLSVLEINMVSFRQKQLAYSDLLHVVFLELNVHHVSSYEHGNQIFYFFYIYLVDMFFSLNISFYVKNSRFSKFFHQNSRVIKFNT